MGEHTDHEKGTLYPDGDIKTFEDALSYLANYRDISEFLRRFGAKKNLSVSELEALAKNAGQIAMGDKEIFLNAQPQTITNELGNQLEVRGKKAKEAIKKQGSGIIEKFSHSLGDYVEFIKDQFGENQKFKDSGDSEYRTFIKKLQIFSSMGALFRNLVVNKKYTESYLDNKENKEYCEDCDKINELLIKYSTMVNATDKDEESDGVAEAYKEYFSLTDNTRDIIKGRAKESDEYRKRVESIYTRVIASEFLEEKGDNSYTIKTDKIRKLFEGVESNIIHMAGTIKAIENQTGFKVETKAHKIRPRL